MIGFFQRELVGVIKVHGPVIIVTLNPQIELVERCISFRQTFPKRCCYHEIGKCCMLFLHAVRLLYHQHPVF
jgi:hypothetical protein